MGSVDGTDDLGLNAMLADVAATMDRCSTTRVPPVATPATVADPRLQQPKAVSTQAPTATKSVRADLAQALYDNKHQTPTTPPVADDNLQAKPPGNKVPATPPVEEPAPPPPREAGGMIKVKPAPPPPPVPGAHQAPVHVAVPPPPPPIAPGAHQAPVPGAHQAAVPPIAGPPVDAPPVGPPRPPVDAPPVHVIAAAAPRVVPPKVASVNPLRQPVQPVPQVIAPRAAKFWEPPLPKWKEQPPREKRQRGSGENSSWHTAWHKAKREGPDAEAVFLHFFERPKAKPKHS